MSTNLPPLPAPVAGSARCVVPAAASLGEGTLWSQREQALYWVDILGCALHRFDPATEAHAAAGTSTRKSRPWPNAPSEPGLIVTLRRGFAFFDPAPDGAPRYLHQPRSERCRATASTTASATPKAASGAARMDFACEAPTGALYRFDPDGRCRRHDERLRRDQRPDLVARRPHACTSTTRSTAASMPTTSTPKRGTLSNKRQWQRFARGDGCPTA